MKAGQPFPGHAFAAALAKIKNSELLTGNAEFKALEKEIRIN